MAMTWSNTVSSAGWGSAISRKAVCDSGTETFGAAATDGASLASAAAWDVMVEADSTRTLSGAGTLQAWVYSTIAGGWGRAPEYDITIPASAASNRRFYPLAGSPGKGVPVIAQQGRIGYAPSGVTVSAGGLTIYIDIYPSTALTPGS